MNSSTSAPRAATTSAKPVSRTAANRWKEAFEARTGENDRKVPKVVLKATNERALEGVKMEDLRGFAVDKE
jgi:uncharacterized protein (DUF2237 family)